MASSSNSIFTGSSRYSNDFASVIQRSVAIASLPLTQLQQQRVTLNDRNTALSSLDSKVASLQSSLSSLGNSFGSAAMQSNLSDGSALKPTISDGAVEASYSIKISDLGSATTFVAAGFPANSDPQNSTYTTANSQTLTFTGDGAPVSLTLNPASHTVQALADEINAKAGTRVRATVVNLGTTSQPNYQLSLQSVKLGAFDISLTDGTNVTQNTSAQRGSSVKYSVNGADVVSDSRTVTLAPGLTAELSGVTTGAISLSLTRSTTQFKAAISSFISAFNNVVAEVDKSRGNKTAPLAGDSILSSVSEALRHLANSSTGSGSIQSLTGLGVGFDQTGKLTFDTTAFDKAASNKFDALKSFVGSATGSGWLKSATGILKGLEDTDTGVLKSSIRTNQDAMTRQDSAIAAQQERIDNLQKDLEQRMAAADAAIAMLEQQVSYFTGMFAAMKSNTDSYR